MPENKFDKVAYDLKYRAEHLERIETLFPKGSREKIKKAAEKLGINSPEFIRQAVDEKLNSVK